MGIKLGGEETINTDYSIYYITFFSAVLIGGIIGGYLSIKYCFMPLYKKALFVLLGMVISACMAGLIIFLLLKN
jgi:hypothetical protein